VSFQSLCRRLPRTDAASGTKWCQPKYQGGRWWTPLGAAVWNDRVEVVQTLVESGELDLEATMGALGRTALTLAVDKNIERIARVL
jgi:hypothetical protein